MAFPSLGINGSLSYSRFTHNLARANKSLNKERILT